jgi:ubiquinone/menaquinone biosynthesis C-methylase UbiE
VLRDYSEGKPELMDMPCADLEELGKDLRNLEIINRCFGGTQAVLKMMSRLACELPAFRMIDLATGYGDHPRNIARWAKDQGKSCTIIAVDRQRPTLEFARAATRNGERILYVQADVRRLPFKSRSVDLVFCSLALHHFSESDAVNVLKESRRLASQAAACIDLVRGRIAYAAVWLLTQFFLRAKMTRHDARASVRRAFTGKELKNMADLAGWRSLWHGKLPLFRQAIACEKIL